MMSDKIRNVLRERLRILRDTNDEWDYGVEKSRDIDYAEGTLDGE